MQEGAEGCDDGNDREGCPRGVKGGCAAEAVWGDRSVWVGEETCDDGNPDEGDGCEADCTTTPAVCGNGEVEAGRGATTGMMRRRTTQSASPASSEPIELPRSWFEAPGTHHAPCKEFGPDVLALLTGPMEAKN